ncbi:hypothetical protein LXA43DRAFT_1096264 [Ganoderma leucocontextum]|nr:hypothetical protein LXA43DRAFT_1096264 [Ganoderma leucocontextum]
MYAGCFLALLSELVAYRATADNIMNDTRYRASNFYIEQQSEAFPQLLPHPHRGVGNVSASRPGYKTKPRRSTHYLCLIPAWVIFIATIGIFIDIPPSGVVRSWIETHSFHSYIPYAALSAAIGDLYPPSEPSNSCTQQEVLSPSTIIGALTIPPREAPSLWDRLSLGNEDGGGQDASWTFQGSNGQVGIRLSSDSLWLSTISLRVPTREGGQPLSCAPRDGILWGIVNQDANFSSSVLGMENGALDDLLGRPIDDGDDAASHVLPHERVMHVVGGTYWGTTCPLHAADLVTAIRSIREKLAAGSADVPFAKVISSNVGLARPASSHVP